MARVNKNLTGTDDNDELIAEEGNLRILGGDGDDVMYASSTTETFHGGDGDDTAYSYAGNDTFFGGDGFDTFVTPGSILDFSVYQEDPFGHTTNNKWSILNNESSALSELKDVEMVRFDNYTLYLDGRNNTPYAENVFLQTQEDSGISGTLSGHVWDLEDALTFTEGTFTTATGASVTIHADGSYTYAPYENYSGPDSFEYSVSDGVNPAVTREVTIDIEAAADTPELAVAIEEGSAVNEARLLIGAALTDTDGSESLQVVISGIAAGVAVTNATQSGSDWIVNDPAQDVLLSWDKETDQDMDLTVTATATEASNGDTASVSVGKEIRYDVTGTSDQLNFYLNDHSIWGTGDAYEITAGKFVGLDIYESGSLGHLDLKAGFQTDVKFNTGSMESAAAYTVDYTAYRNYATDLVALDFDNTYDGASFSTQAFNGEISLDAILDIDAYASVKLPLVGEIELEVDYAPDHPVDILTLNEGSTIEVAGEIPTPIKILSIPFSASGTWPYLGTSASSSTAGTFNAFDSDTFSTANLGAKVGEGFDFSVAGVEIGGSITLLELGGYYEAVLMQSFALHDQILSGLLVLEDGSTMSIPWNDDIVLHNVSDAFDTDGDGLLDFSSGFDLDAGFSNDTDIKFYYGPYIEGLSAEFHVGEVSLINVGPLIQDKWEFNQTLDVYANDFALDYTGDGFDMLIA